MPTILASLTVLSLIGGGWVPAPQESFDRDAGVLCDVPIHAEPIVDHVMKKTLANGDEIYAGKLIVRVTDTDNGDYYDADASGTALVNYADDGTQTWYVTGPVLFGFRENGGTLPRGLWIIDGVYRVVFAPSGYKTVTMVHGTTTDVCPRIE